MDPTVLRQQYQAHLTEAKRLGDAFKGKEHEMPKETMDQIAAELGKADEVKVRLDLASRMSDADAYMREPAQESVTHLGWRESAPDEGNAEVDSKAWRSVKFMSPFGERDFRYHVPLAVQDSKARKYSSAFEAYMRKGIYDLGPNDRKTLTEGTDTAGGFLVPEDYQTELIKKLMTTAAIRALATVAQTSRDAAVWPRVNYTTDDKYTSPVRVTWTGETPSSSTVHRVTDPVFGTIRIPVHTAMASMPLSNDLLEDAVFDVEGYSRTLLAEAFALDEDNVFLNGTGIGQPMGLLTEVNGNGPDYTVSGTNSAFTTSGDVHEGKRIHDVYYDVPGQYRARGVWVTNSEGMQLLEDLVDGNKRPILRDLNTASMGLGEPVVLKGKRIVIDEFVPALATDSYSLIFGDWSGYTILERVGLSIQRLDERYAEDNLKVLLARRRVGGYCTEPYRFRVMKSGTS